MVQVLTHDKTYRKMLVRASFSEVTSLVSFTCQALHSFVTKDLALAISFCPPWTFFWPFLPSPTLTSAPSANTDWFSKDEWWGWQRQLSNLQDLLPENRQVPLANLPEYRWKSGVQLVTVCEYNYWLSGWFWKPIMIRSKQNSFDLRRLV